MADAIITRRGGILTYSLPYLYNEGDECFSVTDGWDPVVWAGTTTYSLSKESDHLYTSVTSASSNAGYLTTRRVDLTNWNYLKADIVKTQSNPSGASQVLIYSMQNLIAGGQAAFVSDNSLGTDSSLTLTINISALTGLYFIACRSQRGTGAYPAVITKFYNVRLTNA